MAKFTVTVEYLVKFDKELTVYAPSESEAEDKAIGIVSAWRNVEDVSVISVSEDDDR